MTRNAHRLGPVGSYAVSIPDNEPLRLFARLPTLGSQARLVGSS